MKRLKMVGAAAAFLVVGFLALAAVPPGEKERSPSKVAFFMRAKLNNSQQVLEGLVTENFELVRAGAERMIVMSKAAEWKVGNGEEYAKDTVQFVDAAKELIRQAKAKNVDGATLSYVQLTMSCVACHNHVRASKVALGDPVPSGLPHGPISSMAIAHGFQ